MKASAIQKDFYMTIKHTFHRFLSLFLIVALGVAFYAGIRSTEPDMNVTLDRMYADSNFLDVRFLHEGGMSEEFVDRLKALDYLEEVEGILYTDVFASTHDNRYTVRIMSLPEVVGTVQLQEGRMPQAPEECIVDSQLLGQEGCGIGDTITIESGTDIPASMYLKDITYKIVGSYTTPYYLHTDKGTTSLGSGKINGLVAVGKDQFLPSPSGEILYSEVQATVRGAEEFTAHSKDYEEKIAEAMDQLKSDLSDTGCYIFDRNSIQNYVEYGMDAERIGKIGTVVPIIFFLVAALVSLTTMTRMVEEERTQIGTLKALGYQKLHVAKKYFLYAFSATLLGSIVGGIVGSMLIPRVIINAYKIMYQNLGTVAAPFQLPHIIIASVISVLCVTLAAVAACYTELSAAPAQLMRPEAPKSGKRVFMERIGFLWKRMNFTWKSTVRNLMRYKKRFFMTIFGIAGCMGLIVLGFGIKDSIRSIVGLQYDELRQYDNDIILKSGMSQQDYARLEEILSADERISSYASAYQTAMYAEKEEENISVYLFVPEDEKQIRDYIKIRDKSSGEELELSENTVVISQKLSKLLGVSVGDTIFLNQSETNAIPVTIGGICENYVYHYVYMNEAMYHATFGQMPAYNEIFIQNTEQDYDNDSFTEDLLSCGYVNGVNSIDTMRKKFAEMLQGLDIIILVIIISAGGLAFVILYNLNNINIGERMRELASLKVLGFYDEEVSAYVFRENIILTLLGIMGGAIFGIWIHEYVIDTVEVDLVMFGRQIRMVSYLYSALITLTFAAIINGAMHFKLKKIDMAASMKSVE